MLGAATAPRLRPGAGLSLSSVSHVLVKAATTSQSRLFHNLVLPLLLLTAAAGDASEPDTNAEIHLRAMLFYAGSGTLSADVLAPDGVELGNVVAGENPSTSTLVIAEISLASDQVLSSDSSVEIVAQDNTNADHNGRILLKRSVTLGAVNRGGKTHLGFWLQDTGCAPIQLRATLRSTEHVSITSTTATIPFVCNE